MQDFHACALSLAFGDMALKKSRTFSFDHLKLTALIHVEAGVTLLTASRVVHDNIDPPENATVHIVLLSQFAGIES